MSSKILEQYNNSIKITADNLRYAKLLSIKKDILAADLETTGLIFNSPSWLHTSEGDIECDNPYPFGVSLAFLYNSKAVLVWARHTDKKLYKQCMDLIASEQTKAWHNSRYDLRVLKENNLPAGGVNHCTLTMSRIHWDRRKSHALDSLTEFLCPQLCEWKDDTKKELTRIKTRYSRDGYEKDYANFSFLPEEMISSRAMIDTFMTLQLYLKLKPIMDSQFSEHYQREMKVIEIVSKIEAHGMAFDSKKARNAARYPRRRMRECMETMKLLVGDWLTTHPPKLVKGMVQLGITRKQLTEKGKVTTEADVLARVLKEDIPDKARQFIECLLVYKGYQKIANTYLLPLAKRAEMNNGIVYTEINPADTRTGRPASKNPNLLNIPNPESRKTGKRNVVRECFVCRPGYSIYYFDVSQQEYAVFGLYADENVLNAYVNGEDIHQYMADRLGMSDQRSRVKNLNFGIVYGMGIRTMKLLYGLTEDDYKMYHREFPSIREFQRMCEYELRQYGYVEDYFGRRYHIPPRQAYKAVNALVQGTCASAFKTGLIAVDDYLEYDCPEESHILLPVYDEIQLESTMGRNILNEVLICTNITGCMSHVPQIEDRGLTFRVDVSKTTTSWAEKCELKLN